MAKRRKMWIGFGVIVLLVAIPMLWPEDEPEYNGRYLREWLEMYEDSAPSSVEDFTALEAVRSIGTKALPYYLEWIAYEPPRWRETLRAKAPGWVTSNTNLNKLLLGGVDRRAKYASSGIKILGTKAISALPVLEALLKDSSKPQKSSLAMWALPYLGEPGIRILDSAQANTNQVNRDMIPYAIFAARNPEYRKRRLPAMAIIPATALDTFELDDVDWGTNGFDGNVPKWLRREGTYMPSGQKTE